MIHDPYQGKTRAEYLSGLAEEFCISLSVVEVIADTLGPDEDFDGLVTQLEDISDLGEISH